MRNLLLINVVVLSAVLAGCAAPIGPKYSWGNYDKSLYSYYKDSTKAAEYAAELEKTIQESEKTQKRVAPGIHAEYGYLLLQQGKREEAIAQFQSEKTKWPESTYLMDSMIQVATGQQKKLAQSKE
jgi:hypothetical protein